MLQIRGFATKTDDAPPVKEKTVRTREKKTIKPPELDENGEIIVKPKRTRKTSPKDAKPQTLPKEKMYVLKFNSPILPYAKFPLTQNKYI